MTEPLAERPQHLRTTSRIGTRRWPQRALLFALLLVPILLAASPALMRHVQAATLLRRFADVSGPAPGASMTAYAVNEEQGTLETRDGPRRMKLYLPASRSDAPGVVLLHGIHRLGVDEPRLARFSRALAGAGITVLTPEVKELADYRIDAASMHTIADAASELARRTGRSKVGVIGMSFAGGLSLMTAADAQLSAPIGFVVSVGGHHDLARVARFFVDHAISGPDGEKLAIHAHDYGILVLLYGSTELFFSAADAPQAHEALRLWLHEDREAARKLSETLSPEGKTRLAQVFAQNHAALAEPLRQLIETHQNELRALSPSGKLANLSAEVFLLHGEGDSVVPATESRWLARETPPARLRHALITPALSHVELGAGPTVGQQLALVHFMAELLESAENEPRRLAPNLTGDGPRAAL